MKFLIYIVFIWFASRGMLLFTHVINESADLIINFIIKFSCILYGFGYLFKKNVEKIIISKEIFLLVFITLCSSVLNFVPIDRVLRFVMNVFYPLAVFLIVMYRVKEEDIPQLFRFIIFFMLVQFLSSVISNFGIFKAGSFVVDDPFFGFFRSAYGFSYFMCALSFYFLYKYIAVRKYKYLLFLSPFIATQFISGSGRIVLIYFATLVIVAVMSIRPKIGKISLILPLLVLIPLIVTYSVSVMNASMFFSDLQKNGIVNNPKIYYFMRSIKPIVSSPVVMFMGMGPTKYMSWTGMFYNTNLVSMYNDELHDLYYTDAFQAFNNIVGFAGELGLFALIFYYSMIFKLLRVVPYTPENTAKSNYVLALIVFSVLMSAMFLVFDDILYSLTFWLLIGFFLRLSSNDELVQAV